MAALRAGRLAVGTPILGMGAVLGAIAPLLSLRTHPLGGDSGTVSMAGCLVAAWGILAVMAALPHPGWVDRVAARSALGLVALRVGLVVGVGLVGFLVSASLTDASARDVLTDGVAPWFAGAGLAGALSLAFGKDIGLTAAITPLLAVALLGSDLPVPLAWVVAPIDPHGTTHGTALSLWPIWLLVAPATLVLLVSSRRDEAI